MHEQLKLMQILSDRLNFKMFLVSIHARFICGVRFFVSMMDPFPEKNLFNHFFAFHLDSKFDLNGNLIWKPRSNFLQKLVNGVELKKKV